MKQVIFPFSAIVGQEAMKTALILNAVDPLIGGVLIRGQKGTGKTTAVRSLPAVLPAETPLVELPLNATEDRIVGTLQIEAALTSGEKRFEPGLLAAANGGILYIDEVNLLEDHLVDLLLDAAATGFNRVEREGISYVHASRFILIGTMNPEEGELRPQFLDRFGLSVSVSGLVGARERLEIVKRRMAFERQSESFISEWEDADRALSRQIETARIRLKTMEPSEDILKLIVGIASEAGSAGHRAEITMLKAAAALAAFVEADGIRPDHVREAAHLVLPHRIELGPVRNSDTAADHIDSLFDESRGKAKGDGHRFSESKAGDVPESRESEEDYAEEFGIDPASVEEMQVPGPTAAGSIVFTFLKKKLHRV